MRLKMCKMAPFVSALMCLLNTQNVLQDQTRKAKDSPPENENVHLKAKMIKWYCAKYMSSIRVFLPHQNIVRKRYKTPKLTAVVEKSLLVGLLAYFDSFNLCADHDECQLRAANAVES